MPRGGVTKKCGRKRGRPQRRQQQQQQQQEPQLSQRGRHHYYCELSEPEEEEELYHEVREDKPWRRIGRWELLDAAPVEPHDAWNLGEIVWARWDSPGARSWWPAVVEPEPGSEYWKEISSEMGAVWNFYVRFFDGLDTRMRLRYDQLRKMDWHQRYDFVPDGIGEEVERDCMLAALKECDIWKEGAGAVCKTYFICGSFVWCRIYPYPWWPAQITVNRETDTWLSQDGRMVWIEFLNSFDEAGDADGWWVTHTSLVPLTLDDTDLYMAPRSNQFFPAIVGGLKLVKQYTEQQKRVDELNNLHHERKRKRVQEAEKERERCACRKRMRKLINRRIKEARKKAQDCDARILQIKNVMHADENKITNLERTIAQLTRELKNKVRTRAEHAGEMATLKEETQRAYQNFYEIVLEGNETCADENELIEDVPIGKMLTIEEVRKKCKPNAEFDESEVSMEPLTVGRDVYARDLEPYQILWARMEDWEWKWIPAFIEGDHENRTVKFDEAVPMAHVTLLTAGWESKWVPLQQLKTFDFSQAENLLPPPNDLLRDVVKTAIADAKELQHSVSCGVARYQVGSYVWARAPGRRWWPAQVVEISDSDQAWSKDVYVEFFNSGRTSDEKEFASLCPARLRPLSEGDCDRYKPDQYQIEGDSSGVLRQIADACDQVKEAIFQKGITELGVDDQSLMDVAFPTLDSTGDPTTMILPLLEDLGSSLPATTFPDTAVKVEPHLASLDGNANNSISVNAADDFVDSLINTDTTATENSSPMEGSEGSTPATREETPGSECEEKDNSGNSALLNRGCKSQFLIEENINRAISLLHQ